MNSTQKRTLKLEIAKLEIKSGEILILRYDQNLDNPTELMEIVNSILPEGGKAIALPNIIEVSLLKK